MLNILLLLQVSQMLPETFSEQLLRIYCKKDDIRGIEMLKKVFADWCKQQGFPPPKVCKS